MLTVEQKKQIITLRRQGLGYKKTAQKIGITVDSVKSYCRRQRGETATKTKKPVGPFCANCGKAFIQPQKMKPFRFCSDECRKSWWSHHRSPKKKALTISCAYCGEEFAAYAHERRKYCSHACYVKDRFGTLVEEGVIVDR